ncbi:MAG: class I SAM-dependent methyltransferase [Candidatus Omnitrophica bacterium]|nr:class I SAM-dependent methyltransferase [Candidatus Omnitrophota bacterium]
MPGIFNRYYQRYDAWYEKNTFAYLSELAALKKAIPREGMGIEIGVGTGRFAAPLGISIGIDPSQKMIAIARQRGVHVCLGKGEQLPFKRSGFDYAALIMTLCFAADPLEVLRETNRVLQKDGRIVVAIIDKYSFLGEKYQQKKGIFYEEARFFGVEELTHLLVKTGFESFFYYQTLFHAPDTLGEIERPKKGFGDGGFVVISGMKN